MTERDGPIIWAAWHGLREHPVWDKLVVADVAIERRQRATRDAALVTLLGAAFPLLRPGIVMPLAADVYRAHCEELLDRVERGGDTRAATDVEVMAALSATSLATPLRPGARCLYIRLFRRRLPQKASTLGLTDSDEHNWGQEADDLHAEMQRKLRQEWRQQ